MSYGVKADEIQDIIDTQEPEYTFDHMGHAHVVWPLLAKKRREQRGETSNFDPETTPSIYIFDVNSRHVLVNKAGFETRDKSKWFPTLEEAMLAKEKALDEKLASLSKRQKSLEAAKKQKEEEAKNLKDLESDSNPE